MGRKPKYSKAVKLQTITDYVNGNKSLSQLSYDLECSQTTVMLWKKLYCQWGETVLDEKPRNSKYTKEFKVSVVQEYLEHKGSLMDLAIKYKIYNKERLRQWVLMYNSGIEILDYDPKGEVYTMKARKTTLEERVEIVHYCLKQGKDYKGTAAKYLIPYSLVYQWVHRYEKNNKEGLSYTKKGPRPKIAVPTTTLEILECENEKLKRELERVNFENEVLKKKEYFEELLYSQESNKKKNIKQ